jgi:uncharacterized SAM-binding protein YcdF (DUF218 family)
MPTRSPRRLPLAWPAMRRWAVRASLCVAALMVVGGGVLAYRIHEQDEGTLRFLGEFLWIREPLEAADIIYVLGGDYERRIPHAARLYKRGLAPRIVIPREDERIFWDRENFSDISRRMLVDAGVPESAIFDWKVGHGVATTIDEARALRLYVDTVSGVRSVIIVTSAYHTRRARYAARRSLGGGVQVQVDGEEYKEWRMREWWRHPAGYGLVRQEYLKLVYYWFRYSLG